MVSIELWRFGLALCILLMSCSAVPPVSVDARRIVVLWHGFSGAEAKALETLTDRFNVENDEGIIVTEHQEDLPAKLQLDPDRRPDLVTLWPQDLRTYVELGIIGTAPTASVEMRRAWDDFLPISRYAVSGRGRSSGLAPGPGNLSVVLQRGLACGPRQCR